MRKTMMGAGAVALLATAAASADGWTRTETFVFDLTNLPQNQPVVWTYVNPDNDQPIVGWSAIVDFTKPPGSFTWASDLKIDFNGLGFFVGGFPAPGGINNWDFQGSGSAPSGVYFDNSHTLMWKNNPIPKGNFQGFTFTNTWTPATWIVTITFYKIPAPGAVALLGLAALVGRRRRA